MMGWGSKRKILATWQQKFFIWVFFCLFLSFLFSICVLSTQYLPLPSDCYKHLVPENYQVHSRYQEILLLLLLSRFSRVLDTFIEGNGNPLQYSCLENPMDGGAWQAAVHGVTKSQTRLSDFTFTFHFHALERAMATHSSTLAWRIPGTEEPSGLLAMGLHRVGHD